MKLISTILILVISALLLQGCNGSMNKQSGGTLVGGLAGGLLGSRFGKGEGQLVATGVGALAGALIGGQVGKTMDDYDRKLAEMASQNALESAPSGKAVAWKNPDSGNYGTVTPSRAVHTNQGYCREYVQEIVVGGEKQKAYGKACRKPDGNWEIAS